MATISVVLNRDGEDFPVEVEYTHHRGYRGARDSLGGRRGAGPPLEPDEDPYDEIEQVIHPETGEEVEITDREQEQIQEEIAAQNE